MTLPKERLKRLVNLNEVTLSNDDVDDFFTLDVLNKRLKQPLKQHADTLISTYELFRHRLHPDCRYIEGFVKQDEKDILFTTFFDCNQHKFMLVMFSQPENLITEQFGKLHGILNSFENIKESQVSIHDETLPETIHELIKALIAIHINPHDLKLKKIETQSGDKTIVFHSINYIIDVEATRGISIVAGFQY